MRGKRLGVVGMMLLAGAGCGGGPPAAGAGETGDPARDAWARVLAAHVRDGGVDYAGLRAERADLDAFLASLDAVRPATLSESERLAFWTNAYNAVVLHHVLDRYPGIESVKAVDGFFDELTFPVAGEKLTLDEIETRGRDLGDARIHFAVVCASTSCPDLPAEPFEPERLDAQFEAATRSFLADESKGLRWDAAERTLWLSSIFKWYAGDFTGGSTVVAFFARGKVLDWVVEHVPEPLRATLRERQPSIRYLDYDWTLNDRPGS